MVRLNLIIIGINLADIIQQKTYLQKAALTKAAFFVPKIIPILLL